MKAKFPLCLLFVLMAAVIAQADESRQDQAEQAKTLSGMSIVGNDEAPKSLYIVPWKSSKVGRDIVLNMPERKGFTPVDPDVFGRKIDYYYFSKTSKTGR